MFDLSWSELVVIAVVALIAIGPKELPGVLRAIGHWMGKIRRMAGEFQSQFQEAMREAEMEDLKKHADDLNDVARTLTKPLDPTDYLGKLDTPASDTPAPTASQPAPAAVEPASAPPADAGAATDSAALMHSETRPEEPAALGETGGAPGRGG
jgi:sec-independent protein translocase protein TatB